MASGNLKAINVRSGVNEDGVGFCHVMVNGGDLMGQLSPEEVRQMALAWLGAAEAAESDAAVFGVLRDIGLEPAMIGAVLADMRGRRADG